MFIDNIWIIILLQISSVLIIDIIDKNADNIINFILLILFFVNILVWYRIDILTIKFSINT